MANEQQERANRQTQQNQPQTNVHNIGTAPQQNVPPAPPAAIPQAPAAEVVPQTTIVIETKAATPGDQFREKLIELSSLIHQRRLSVADAKKTLHAWWHGLSYDMQIALGQNNLITAVSNHTRAGLDELHNEIPLLLSQTKVAPEVNDVLYK